MNLILRELDLPFYEPFSIIEKTEGRKAEELIMGRLIRFAICLLLVISFAGCTKPLETKESEPEFKITEADRTKFKEIIADGALMGLIYDPDFIEFDVTDDGNLDLCASVTQGSGIVSASILVYDVFNQVVYKLDDRGFYDYWIETVEDDAIYIRRADWQRQNDDGAILGILEFEDGELKFIEATN